MIYSFSNDIFTNLSEENWDLIDKIWHLSKERHFLFIGNHDNLTAIKQSEWYNRLRRTHQEQIDCQLVASINVPKSKQKIGVAHQSTETHFSLVEAHPLLNQPLTIVLENIEYDRYFMDSLVKHFSTFGRGKTPNLMSKYYKNGWLIYANGGGNNIPNVINSAKHRFEINKIDFPKPSCEYIRTFILIDSDKKYPLSDEVPMDKIQLLNFIKANSPYHVLAKREIENYLPDIVFTEIIDNQPFKEAFLRLNPVQKDFFDIEKGFPDKPFKDLEQPIRDLYEDVSDVDKQIFRKNECIFRKSDGKKDNFKPRFSKLFESSTITRAYLEQRAHSKELEEIIQKINDLL